MKRTKGRLIQEKIFPDHSLIESTRWTNILSFSIKNAPYPMEAAHSEAGMGGFFTSFIQIPGRVSPLI
jgi:hypothetical protein